MYCEYNELSFPLRITVTAYSDNNISVEKTVILNGENPNNEEYNFVLKDKSFLLEVWCDAVSILPDKLYAKIQTTTGETEIQQDCEYATIKGKITDFDGKPFPASVQFFRYGFSYPHRMGVWSDSEGNYSVTVPKGRYNAIFVDDDSYRKSTLENWCWNMIIDCDETLDFKVGTGEIYSLTPWFSNGGMPVMFLYFRPMILGYKREYKMRINSSEYNIIDIAPQLEPKDIKVTANNKDLQIISLQTIYETCDGMAMPAYILQVEKPRYSAEKQRVTVEYCTDAEGYTAASQGRCQFYFKDSFGTLIK
ncbi:MAG: carboxypeptidase regulatory-like domain-containing protein [Oscillospiraceae bacterium]|nr:carboxypeptidase regulatory-like domain-containing protein [Oscillospiraceae bacterium]